jgi:glycosidase
MCLSHTGHSLVRRGCVSRCPVLPQGFGWDACEKGGWWNQLKEKLPDVASAGVSHIWLPPPSESVAPQVSAAAGQAKTAF